jgi:activator of HSP90 ATPase
MRSFVNQFVPLSNSSNLLKMAKTITQKVVFKNTSSKELYDLYMNEKKHSEVIGGSAKITTKIGANFSAYDNYITGKNLHLLKDTIIVQTWRGSDWKKNR